MILDGRALTKLSLQDWYRSERVLRSALELTGRPVPPVTQLAGSERAVRAAINWGRLIAECPECHAGLPVWREGPYQLYCIECWADNEWLPVILPAELAEIERVLSLRPEQRNRNWQPGETLVDLQTENLARGLEA